MEMQHYVGVRCSVLLGNIKHITSMTPGAFHYESVIIFTLTTTSFTYIGTQLTSPARKRETPLSEMSQLGRHFTLPYTLLDTREYRESAH